MCAERRRRWVRVDLDAGVIAHLARAVAGHGRAEVILAQLGGDLRGPLMRPRIAEGNLSEETHRSRVAQVITLLRSALEPVAGPFAASSWPGAARGGAPVDPCYPERLDSAGRPAMAAPSLNS